MAGKIRALSALPWNNGMAQYGTDRREQIPDDDARAARPWVIRTALGAPDEPEVNNSAYRSSGPTGASTVGSAPTPASRDAYSAPVTSHTRSGARPRSRPASNATPAGSVRINWQSV